MRILIISDLHGSKTQMQWIERQPADLLIIAGDISTFGEGQDGIKTWLLRLPFAAAIATGNHEWMGDQNPRWLYELRHERLIVDQAGIIRRIPIVCLPWPRRGEENHWYENAMESCRWAESLDEPWILVTHAPPQFSKFSGSAEIMTMSIEDVTRPTIAVCGHTHVPAMWRNNNGVLWINAGACEGDVPHHAWINWNEKTSAITLADALGERVLAKRKKSLTI